MARQAGGVKVESKMLVELLVAGWAASRTWDPSSTTVPCSCLLPF
jgi:hypothetical protein